ncbi:MAG: ABC transporter ATP-binding protein [Bacteroidota bacterium]|nr:ABC transporter ATP-binding protein [Bacteroidota bacterium]
MKLLLKYLKPYQKTLIVTLILAAINQCFSLLDPMIAGQILNEIVLKYDKLSREDYMHLAFLFLGLSVGVALVSRVAKNIQDYYTNVIIQKMGADIYAKGLKHSLQLPFQTFEDQRSGETLSVLQKVRTDSERLITSFISVVFSTLVGIVFIMIYAISKSWKIAAIYVVAIAVVGIISSILGRKIKIMQKKIVGETTALAGSTTESLRNIELVKSLGLADQEISRLNRTTFKILGLELKKVKYIRSLSFLQGTTVQLTRSIMLLMLLVLIFGREILPGDYLTFMFYSFFLFGPLQEFGNIIIMQREAEISLANFKKIIDTPIEAKPQNPVETGHLKEIRFTDVSYRHQTAQHDAVSNISFEAKQGETIAFVGPSGAGKTTLVKLLVGLYKPANGKIYYNGIGADEVDMDAFRHRIGFVTQDAQLFSGTIRENMEFVKPDATGEQIMDVLNKSSCQNLLARAEKGIDTNIGENGMKISGGEKQRISIARALLRDPQLLIFDEATSSLDSLTEDEISQTVKQISIDRQQITVMIAHRLSTIMHANKIYVLERGQVVETGKHEDLLAEKGLYYAMWRQQIGERKREVVMAAK